MIATAIGASASPAAISAAGLVKRYGGLAAVDGLDLEIPAGQFFGLLGPNGSGKTTTIHMLATLVRPTEGRVKIGEVEEDQEMVRGTLSPTTLRAARYRSGPAAGVGHAPTPIRLSPLFRCGGAGPCTGARRAGRPADRGPDRAGHRLQVR